MTSCPRSDISSTTCARIARDIRHRRGKRRRIESKRGDCFRRRQPLVDPPDRRLARFGGFESGKGANSNATENDAIPPASGEREK